MSLFVSLFGGMFYACMSVLSVMSVCLSVIMYPLPPTLATRWFS